MTKSFAQRLAGCGVLGLVACSTPSGLDTAETPADLLGQDDQKWEDPAHLRVCWVDPKAEHQDIRDAVERSIRASWEFFSGHRLAENSFYAPRVQTEGWQACEPQQRTRNISIALSDIERSWSNVGKVSATRYPSMELGFLRPDCRNDPYCIFTVAVHEFGHALGFPHEQLRKDTTKSCVDELKKDHDWPVDSTVEYIRSNSRPLTPEWDKFSVMNYCNPKWHNHGLPGRAHLKSL